MSKLKKTFIIFVFFIFAIVSAYSMSYAASVKVTEENLKSSLQGFISSKGNTKKYKITVKDNQLKVLSDDGNYTINYDLTKKPKFTYEAKINKGMSYKEFQEKTGGSSMAMLGYCAVANIQGVEYEDSLAYFGMYLLSTAFSSSSETDLNNSYVIIDDTQDGVTIKKDSNDTKTIYVSEFGNSVMEYVNKMYSKKQTIKDSDSFNTFEMTTERKDVTDTSCKLVTTLTVNTDADFSKMIGYLEKMSDTMDDITSETESNIKDNTETDTKNDSDNKNDTKNNENKKNDEANNNKKSNTSRTNSSSKNSSSKSNESVKDNTVAKTVLPKTGTEDIIVIISVCVMCAVLFGIVNRIYKDIK